MIYDVHMSQLKESCEGCNKHRKPPKNNACLIVRFKTKKQTKNCPCNKCIIKVNCSQLCNKLLYYFFKVGNPQ
jgi:hypothetical protein